MRAGLQIFLRFLETVEGFVATLAYAGVALLLIGDIVAREILGMPVLGAQTIAVLAAIVAGFLGLSLATASGSHLKPEFIDRLFPSSIDRYLDRASDLVSAALFFTIAWFAFRFVGESLAAGDRAAILFFPLWPIQLIMPYTFLSCATRHLLYGIDPDLKSPLLSLGDEDQNTAG